MCGKKCKAHTDHLFPFRLVRSWGLDPNDLNNLNSLCNSDHTAKTHVEQKLFSGDWMGFWEGMARLNFPYERLLAACNLYKLEVPEFYKAAFEQR